MSFIFFIICHTINWKRKKIALIISHMYIATLPFSHPSWNNSIIAVLRSYLGGYGNAFEGTGLVKSCTARLRSISFASALHRFLLRFYLFSSLQRCAWKCEISPALRGARCLSRRRNCKFQFARETEDAARWLHQRHARHDIVCLMQCSRGVSRQ